MTTFSPAVLHGDPSKCGTIDSQALTTPYDSTILTGASPWLSYDSNVLSVVDVSLMEHGVHTLEYQVEVTLLASSSTVVSPVVHQYTLEVVDCTQEYPTGSFSISDLFSMTSAKV